LSFVGGPRMVGRRSQLRDSRYAYSNMTLQSASHKHASAH
jgi:hypothetical protein